MEDFTKNIEACFWIVIGILLVLGIGAKLAGLW